MLTGEGTTHRVNGIIVQPQVYGPHLPTAAAPVIERRNRELSHRNFNLSTLTYQVKEWHHNHVRLVAQLKTRKVKVNAQEELSLAAFTKYRLCQPEDTGMNWFQHPST